MAKPISEQLAGLSARAKEAEDQVKAAESQALPKAQQRVDEIKASATSRKESVRQQASKAEDNVSTAWSGMTKKVESDFDELRAKIDYKKYEHNREQVFKAADEAEESATRAIYFAFDAIDYAETAVLDAVLARETARSL